MTEPRRDRPGGTEDAALCRAVADIYRLTLEEAMRDVARRVSEAIQSCQKTASAGLREAARLTEFTRCLAERVRVKRA